MFGAQTIMPKFRMQVVFRDTPCMVAERSVDIIWNPWYNKIVIL